MISAPLFIVFEGIDGSGKSTQSDLLFRYIESKSIDVVKLFEPTDGEWGRRIRQMLKGEAMPPADELLELFIRDRKDDVEKNIMPIVSKNIIVMDRYYYSNAAYQGAAGISSEKIIALNKENNFPEPDRVYFIDIQPGTAVERIIGRDDKGREVFEKESFLKKVRDIYLSVADEKFMIIDGTKGIDEIFNIIKDDMEGKFGPIS